MHYLRVNPPECYKCAICGIFGDFQNEQMQTCDGQAQVEYGGWTNAWDEVGWSWERTYTNEHCPPNKTIVSNQTIVYVINETVYTGEDPCDAAISEQVKSECAVARADEVVVVCCVNIGGTFCDDLQRDCEIDACVGSEGNASLFSDQINEFFYNLRRTFTM